MSYPAFDALAVPELSVYTSACAPYHRQFHWNLRSTSGPSGLYSYGVSEPQGPLETPPTSHGRFYWKLLAVTAPHYPSPRSPIETIRANQDDLGYRTHQDIYWQLMSAPPPPSHEPRQQIEATLPAWSFDTIDNITRTCISCASTCDSTSCPDPPEGSQCQHENEACLECWESWILAQLETKTLDKIKCIQCSNYLNQSDVRVYASRETYQRFLDLELKTLLSSHPNFIYCIARTGTSGQIHEWGNIFTCAQCGHRHCIDCKKDWHSGYPCGGLEAERLAGRKRAGDLARRRREERQSEEAVKRTTKPCPGCKKPIEKNGGCEHMTCSRCRYEFCWLCLVDYKRVRDYGNGAHERSCSHWRGS